MSCYRRNFCRARWNALAIREPHALPRHSTGEFNAQLASTARHHLGASPSRPRSDIGHRRCDPTEAACRGGGILDSIGNLVGWFRNPGGIRAVRSVDLPMRSRSVGRSPRPGRDDAAACGSADTTAGKPLAATGQVVAGHRHPRVPGPRLVAFATIHAALVSPRRGLAEAPHRRQQAIVTRATGCTRRSVVA
jgi:hypothetical protein